MRRAQGRFAFARKAALLVLLVLALLLVAGCAAATPGAALAPTPTGLPMQKLRLCTSATSGTQVVGWYALDRGFFAKHGLDVSLVPLSSGTLAATALLAGEADICMVAGSAIVNAAVAGGDLVMFMGYFNTYPGKFIVLPSITSPDDLRGKSVGISQIGSASDTMARRALRTLGLEPDRDVTILAIGDDPARLTAMETGRIAGAVFTPPSSYQALQHGYRELLNFAQLNQPVQHIGAAASRSVLQAQRPAFVAFARATSEAMTAMRKDPDGVKAVLADHLGYDVRTQAGLLDETYQVLIVQSLAAVPYPTVPGLQSALDELTRSNPKAGDFKAESVADMSIVKELEDSGLYVGLTGK